MTNSNSKGGYRNLVVYQMVQAARSGKQNIVEASLIRSLEGNIKLTGVSRGSFGELLEDYLDFLRTKSLNLWDKNDPRVIEIRAVRVFPNKSNLTNSTNLARYARFTKTPESFCNLMITLLHLENYLLDQLIRKLEEKFIAEGGFRENLFRRRQERRQKQ